MTIRLIRVTDSRQPTAVADNSSAKSNVFLALLALGLIPVDPSSMEGAAFGALLCLAFRFATAAIDVKIAIAIWVLAMVPYCLISYYERYSWPMFPMQVLIVYAAIGRRPITSYTSSVAK